MIENIHYSYSMWLSYYTFGVLVLGCVASIYSQKIAGAMKLIGLLGLLTINVSSTYFARLDLLQTIEITPEILRISRLLLLCWLPWGIFELFVNLLKVRWKKIRNYMVLYSICLCSLYLSIILILPQPIEGNTVEIFEIIIYFILAVFSIIIPVLSIYMGIGNSLSGQGGLPYWYRSTETSLLICALLQILSFVPLYFFYFPHWNDVTRYAENNLGTGRELNFMPIYYLFFTLPFTVHVLYYLIQNSRNLVLAAKSGITANTDNNNKNQDLENLSEFFTSYNISKREQDVLVELITGYSYAAIAEHLYISLATVKSHIYSIYRKTEVKSKIQLLSKIMHR